MPHSGTLVNCEIWKQTLKEEEDDEDDDPKKKHSVVCSHTSVVVWCSCF
jgi:hypothetical protein